jgi:hypothetical protein
VPLMMGGGGATSESSCARAGEGERERGNESPCHSEAPRSPHTPPFAVRRAPQPPKPRRRGRPRGARRVPPHARGSRDSLGSFCPLGRHWLRRSLATRSTGPPRSRGYIFGLSTLFRGQRAARIRVEQHFVSVVEKRTGWHLGMRYYSM